MLVADSNSFMSRIMAGFARRWRRIGVEIASRTGHYRRYRDVDWSRVKRLVFVCSGNICRSPFAEHVALGRGFRAISCGTTALPGSLADPMAIEVAARMGMDLTRHRSSEIQDVETAPTDLFVVMDINHLMKAKAWSGEVGAQVTLLGLWDGLNPVVIDDPFGRPKDEFEQCFARICRCLDELLPS